MQVWILTFNRPQALNRQINTFGASPIHDIHIFSNHPEVRLTEENSKRVKSVTYNTLSDPEANSYCARSWNNIFIKAFKDNEELRYDVNNGITLCSQCHRKWHKENGR